MRKLLLFAAMCLMALPMRAQDYVDLGLPSGTLWESIGEQGYYTYDEAISKFADALPTKEQFDELIRACTWTWVGDGYDVEGPNENAIFLPAAGYRHCLGRVYNVGTIGYYWSSTLDDSETPLGLYLSPESVSMDFGTCYRSVCLVKKK